MANFGVQNVISQLKANKLFIPNKFVAVITESKKSTDVFKKNKESLQFLVKSFKTPGYSVNWHENTYTGTGIILGTALTGKIEDVKIDFYNTITGNEYNTCINEIKQVMNFDSNMVGYHDDITRDIHITCYDETAEKPGFSVIFYNAILSNVGGLSFSHDAKEWQWFDTQWSVTTFRINNPKT
jgi:hypothetical protein